MMQGRSLTKRLTLFFTGIAATVVLGLGGLFMNVADQHFRELDRATLLDKKHLIEEVLTNVHSPSDTRWRLNEALSHHHGLFVAVADKNSASLFQSDGFVAPENLQSVPINQEASVLHSWTKNGRELRVLKFKTRPGYDPASELTVTIVMDIAHHIQFLSDLKHKVTFYAIVATLVSGLLGWFAAHQGMAPLRAMKTRAAGVTGQQLDGRMPVDAVPIEMAELAGELNRMLDRLQSDFNRLQEFSSDLAHELRTPISNLLTQTQVTLSVDRDETTYRDILASNAEELQRLARMVSDMLFLAKTECTVDLPHKECFSAVRETQALCEFYEAVADEKCVTLNIHGDGAIVGDRLMFRRAMSNLLSNALRHTPEDGTVCVLISESLKCTEITVENTGQDIDPQSLPRLFDRFFRADPARSHTLSDGTGLGLPITKAIVEAHGGRVTVESGQGKTKFRLIFPKF